jgi:hypothetical protein
LELDLRPTQEDFETRVQQCNALRIELTNVAEKASYNEKLIEHMQMELKSEQECRMAMICVEERSIQTDVELLSMESIGNTKNESPAVQMESIKCDVSTNTVLIERLSPLESEIAATAVAQLKSKSNESSITMPSQLTDAMDDDDIINNHPKVLYEDELIIFKEKCTNLAADKIRLQRELNEMRDNVNHSHTSWLYNMMLKYLVPMLIVFVAYIIFLFK